MISTDSSLDRGGGYGFKTTHWSVILEVSAADPDAASEALSQLCRDYWHPLYNFVRRWKKYSETDAEDAVQGFMAYLIKNERIKQADSERGRFRTFLIFSFRTYLSGMHDKSRAQKRGGDAVTISPEDAAEDELAGEENAAPDREYEVAFAKATLTKCVQQLENEYQRKGKADQAKAFMPHLTGNEDESIREAGARLGLAPDAARQALKHFRDQYRELVHEEVRRLVPPEDFHDELAHMRRILGG